MARKSDFTLPTYDDLFSTQRERDEAQLKKIREIPMELIDSFQNHPFKVRDDEDMSRLKESIESRGVLTPAIVREKEDGRYELISGHRRKKACEDLGMETLRCEVQELSDIEAVIVIREEVAVSNWNKRSTLSIKSHICSSEIAYAIYSGLSSNSCT